MNESSPERESALPVSPQISSLRAGAARALADVLRARRPDLAWQIGGPVKRPRREDLSLNGEVGWAVPVGDHPHAVIGTATPANPDDIERAA